MGSDSAEDINLSEAASLFRSLGSGAGHASARPPLRVRGLHSDGFPVAMVRPSPAFVSLFVGVSRRDEMSFLPEQHPGDRRP